MAEKLEVVLDTLGVSQAVNQLTQVASALGALGMGRVGAAAGPAGIVLGTVVIALEQQLKRLTTAVQFAADATQRLAGFSMMRFRLGSSAADTLALRNLGAGLGVGDVAGSAARLHHATLSGLGSAEAARLGLQFRPHEIGTGTDRGQMLMRTLEGLRQTFKDQGFGAAVAMARNLDVEEWLNVVYLMDRQFRELSRDAAASSGMFSEQRLRSATQFNYEISRLSNSFEDAKTAVGGFIAGGLNAFIQGMRGAFKVFAQGNLIGMLINAIMNRITGGGSAGGTAHTQALRENSMELRRLSGIYGGGNRTRTAIPGAFGPGNGWALQNALRSQNVRLGAYSVAL